MNPAKLIQKVFIGIKVTTKIAEKCVQIQNDLKYLSGKFIHKNDLHLTLVPPWQMDNQRTVEEKLKALLKGKIKFTLKLKRLSYGPKNRNPQIAWIECEPSKYLIELQKKLSQMFKTNDPRKFRPHITLVRFKKQDKIKFAENPIEKKVEFLMRVDSIQLFESLYGGGAGYKILASFKLKKPLFQANNLPNHL